MREFSYWVIEFTGIDGEQHELSNKFSTQRAASRWAKSMPDWQCPTVRKMYDQR